ncbi:MAG: serine/threonine protein kinase [Pirellulaceae bacterium]|nr:serine/threonine protein kinase [Pirellulaceae bacterium]
MQAIACPNESVLSDLMAGRIDELSENSLVQHIQDCDQCRGRAQRLEQQPSDYVLQLLHVKDGDSAYFGEPDCRWSTTRALAVIAGGAGDETQADQFELPLQLGDYRILEPVAQGGMGMVYRAQHLRLGRDVAVKIISGRRLADRRAVQRFEAEMRTLGQLSHPNIVAALDARELAGQPVLVMEYVDGMDLSSIAQRLGPLPPEVVAAIGGAVAAALDYANRNGLIHRDVKPSNVMINSSGQVKLLDLGLARLQTSATGDTSGTITGLTLGTADYMSPEQIHDARSVDARADLYSLGCTLYKLLTGAVPYSGPRFATNFAKLQGHVSDQPIRVPQQYRQGSQPLVELIERLTAKQRESRPDSTQQVSEQLAALGQDANLAQLVSLALKAPELSQPIALSDNAPSPAMQSGSSRRSRIPPWLRWTLATSFFPIGLALGIWLTVKKSDGTLARIQLPAGAAANVDPHGNVELNLGDSKQQGPQLPEARLTPGSELPKFWSGQPAQATRHLGMSMEMQTVPKTEGGIDDRELESLMQQPPENAATYRGYTYEQWQALMSRESEVETASVAIRALIALAQSTEQQREVFDQIIRKSRKWGSIIIGGTSHEAIWMSTFLAEATKLPPAVLIATVAEELENCNKQSYMACYWTVMGIVDPSSFSNIAEFGEQRQRFQPDELPRDLVVKLLSNLESAGAKLTIEEQWKYSFSRYAMRLAGAIQLPYSDMPKASQDRSKRSWERLAGTPLDQIYRHSYPSNPPYSKGDLESYLLPTAWDWRPYWSSLPPDQRQPLRVLHQIFQDQVLREPELNLQETLAALTVVSEDEKQKIKLFLTQRLADSDFDHHHDVRRIIWPEVLKWCVQTGIMDNEMADRTQQIIAQTNSSIAEIVGNERYAQINPRSAYAIPAMSRGSMGTYSGGMGAFDADVPELVKHYSAIEQMLERWTLHLSNLFELPEDVRVFKYRLPSRLADFEAQSIATGLSMGGLDGGMGSSRN